MPQKRNPVALEHARAISSKAVGQAQGILVAVHNTPFGDIVDTEDDLQPLVFAMFRDAHRAVRLVAAAMKEATFDTARMAARAEQGWITVTELADTLARDHGVPFKTSHAIAARFVAACAARPGDPKAVVLREVSASLLESPVTLDEAALATILSPRHFVEIRTTHGGPAPSVTKAAIDVSGTALTRDRDWLSGRIQHLREAEQALEQAEQAL
jgi:argininosuccinate lyase